MRVTGAGLVVIAFCILPGCVAQQPAPVYEASSRTYDGLYPVENVSVGGVWARPDIDLSGYDKILLRGTGIQYRPVHARGEADAAMEEGASFPLTGTQKDRLAAEFAEAFRQELAKSERFEYVEAFGPGVLIVRGGLLDVVSRVPPASLGRPDVYLESLGAATLVIELVDPETNTVLLRAIDRREVQGSGDSLPASAVTSWQEVRRLADDWAQRLREGLDSLDRRMTLD